MFQLTNKKILAGLLGLVLVFSLFAPMLVLGFSGTIMAQGPTTDPDPFDIYGPGAGAVEAPGAGAVEAPGAGATGLTDAGKVPLENPLGTTDIFTIINRIITAALGLTGILALIAFIYGGVLWMVSLGDAGKIEKGKKMLIWAVIGLAVVFTSYGAITLIFRALGIAGV